jgi:hypothetical protein
LDEDVRAAEEIGFGLRLGDGGHGVSWFVLVRSKVAEWESGWDAA